MTSCVFAVAWYYYDLPISVRVTSLALGQSYMIAPVPVKQPWMISVNQLHETPAANDITTAKQSTKKKCVHILWDVLCVLYIRENKFVIKQKYLILNIDLITVNCVSDLLINIPDYHNKNIWHWVSTFPCVTETISYCNDGNQLCLKWLYILVTLYVLFSQQIEAETKWLTFCR